MKSPKTRIMNAIVVLLESTYLHGYEILKDIQDEYGEIRLSTFYRWLRELESSGIISGTIFPGQRGPDRRLYSLTQSGRDYVLGLVGDSAKLLVNFYERYKLFSAIQFEGLLTKYKFPRLSEPVLFTSMSRIRGFDMGTLRYISRRVEGKSVDVVGDAARISNIGVKYKILGGTPIEIPVRNSAYCEVWVSGTPRKHNFPDIVRECARVLKPEGVLRLVVPFMFSRSAQEQGIGGFVQYVSLNLLPEFELVEQEDIITLLEFYFSEVRIIESGILIFLGKKSG